PTVLVTLAGLLIIVLGGLVALLRWSSAGRKLYDGRKGDASYPNVPHAFRPFWFGLAGWLLACLAAAIGFGFSTAFAYLVGRVTAHGGDLPMAYSSTAAVWGVLSVVTVVVLLVPLVAGMLDASRVA